ncbi:MAG: adenosylcobinamide-phosphate synthase CbiB [Syntrophales bacterium]|nr:adenosylcobinamide-phosphate synthase CbiB [Syntrophales bacterium]
MKLEYQILTAFLLELVLGGLPRLFNPARLIARATAALEAPFRRIYPHTSLAGTMLVIVIVTATGVAAVLLMAFARAVSPLLGDVVAIALLYTTFATRALARQSLDVYDSLIAGDLDAARRRVGLLVAGGPATLDTEAVVQTTVEGVGKNMNDAVTAPLCYALLGGPVGALLYKAIHELASLLDREKALHDRFGWAATRLAHLAQYLPARITGLIIPVAAALMNLDARRAFRIMKRDAAKYPDGNTGFPMAAVAGALGVRLGGRDSPGDIILPPPYVGDPRRPLEIADIRRVTALMVATAASVLMVGIVVRSAF